MKKTSAFLLFTFLFSFAFAQVKPQTVTKSSVVFHIKNLGVTIDGIFAGFKADIRFDPANLVGSTMEASVETNTIDTDNGTRNDHLKGDGYFDVARYPNITMKSVSFKHKSGDNYVGTFTLTIKDKTNTIEVPFSFKETGNAAIFKGNFQIKRTDYGVGQSSMVMSDNVKVEIEVDIAK